MKLPDIDIDVADRDGLLNLITHVPAAIVRPDKTLKHKTGVYFNVVPINEITGNCGIDHRIAENRNYFKWDILNMSVYNLVKSREHLDELMAKPTPWSCLENEKFCRSIVHVGNYYPLIAKFKPFSIEDMAVFLSLIRPGNANLVEADWDTILAKIWDNSNEGYVFKRSHSISYATLVSLDIKLKAENPTAL